MLTAKPSRFPKAPIPANKPPKRKPASPPIIRPFIKLPPLKNPRFALDAVPAFVPVLLSLCFTLFVVDFFGVVVYPRVPDLKPPPPRLASAKSGAVTAKNRVKAMRIIITRFIGFIEYKYPPISFVSICFQKRYRINLLRKHALGFVYLPGNTQHTTESFNLKYHNCWYAGSGRG
ncbi:hypothetical protein D3C75_1043190 [compost metagenome]